MENFVLDFIWKTLSNRLLENSDEREPRLPDIKIYYKVTKLKTRIKTQYTHRSVARQKVWKTDSHIFENITSNEGDISNQWPQIWTL